MARNMMELVAFGTGSPVIADVEESAFREGSEFIAGIKNHPGESFLSPTIPEFSSDAIPAELKNVPFLVPIFGPAFRQMATRDALAAGLSQIHTLVDPTNVTPRELKCGAGTYVNSGVVLGSASFFGEFVFINRGACIGHHAKLDSFVSVGPGAVIAGNVTIGFGAVVGAGAILLPSITIGSNAVVGAGAVVTRSVPPNCQVAGNPAKITKRRILGYKGFAVSDETSLKKT
jgi:sugar O-acyltransferase (sialic acid O-acetyltransferase NeuD family)